MSCDNGEIAMTGGENHQLWRAKISFISDNYFINVKYLVIQGIFLKFLFER